MREIKFRAWDEQFGILLDWSDIKVGLLLIIEWGHYRCMQYTGLKDKNGTEIYEGDILQFDNGEVVQVVWVGVSAQFAAKSPKYEAEHIIDDKRYEVIGNIYENPELLGANKE